MSEQEGVTINADVTDYDAAMARLAPSSATLDAIAIHMEARDSLRQFKFASMLTRHRGISPAGLSNRINRLGNKHAAIRRGDGKRQ